MERTEGDGFIGSVIFNDGGRDIALNTSINADNINLNDQSIFVGNNLPKTDQNGQDDNSETQSIPLGGH